MKKEEMIEMLKDPDVLAAVNAKASNDGELEELMAGIDIADDDTIESIAKKQQKQIGKLVTYFNNKLEAVEESAVTKATAKDTAKTAKEIADFHAANPGMNNPEVVAMMQPLYDNGMPLADCYAKACRGLEIDPETGEAPKEQTPEEKAKEAKDKEVADKAALQLSNKSLIPDDADEDEDKGKKAELSLEEVVSANMNALIAKNGNPFAVQ